MAPAQVALLVLASVASSVQSATLDSAGRSLRGTAAAQPAPSGGQVRPLSVPDSRTPIHLLISAFQDGDRCAKTLFRALAKAKHQERVSFSVLQAAGTGDTDCLEEFKSRHLPRLCRDEGCASEVLARVHFWKIPPEEGKGPLHQRGLLSERADLSGKGSMCLSTDSHMDFTREWDSDLLADWLAADNEFAVLTAYPLATADAQRAGKQTWVSLCGYFLSNGMPRGATGGTEANPEEKGKPILTMNWAAGQSFSRCHAEKNVPVDKSISWIFDGEEVDRAVRFWTHGYDLYNPRVSVVLHNYSHASQRFWSYTSPDKDAEEEAGHRRLQELLQGSLSTEEEFGRFGLGKQRSLEQYVTWSRTDLGGKWEEFLKSKGMEPMFAQEGGQPGSISSFCKMLQRVPVRSTEELVASIDA